MQMRRYPVLDVIRGVTLVSMILYHAVWDLVFLFGLDWDWYRSEIGYLWQQSICWTFILLSGFCWSLGRKSMKRGIMVLGAGGLITLVTIMFMPEQKVVFGIFTMIGSSMLLLIPLKRLFKRWNPVVGGCISFILFLLLRNIDKGYLGFEGLNLVRLPQAWYANLFTTYLGLPAKEFYSSDYFGLFPWIFLYFVGYFLYRFLENRKILDCFKKQLCPQLGWLGRHSLELYLIHQPLLYFSLNMIYLL